MTTPSAMEPDVSESMNRALRRQGWLFGERFNRIGNPFVWIDGDQLPTLDAARGAMGVLQYLAMSGEIYETPAAIRVDDHDRVLAAVTEDLTAVIDHIVPFRWPERGSFDRYIASTASVKTQDYAALRSWIPDMPTRPSHLDIGPGLGANALYSRHGFGGAYLALEAHGHSYHVQRLFLSRTAARFGGRYLDVVDCETFDLPDAAIAGEVADLERYDLRHVPSWRFDLVGDDSIDLVSATWVLNEVNHAGITWLLHHVSRTLKPGGHFYIRDSGRRKPGRHDLDYDNALLSLGFEQVARLDIVNRVDMHGIPRLFRKTGPASAGFEELFERLFGRFSIVAHGGSYVQDGSV